MNSKKYIVAVIVGFLLTSSSLLAQKKLVDDIYTYNYTKIINQNGGKAIAKKIRLPTSARVGLLLGPSGTKHVGI